MKRMIRIPYELALPLAAAAYQLAGLALTRYFYGERVSAMLPALALSYAVLVGTVLFLGRDRRPVRLPGLGWRLAAWAVLAASSLMIVLETGYMYAPDGIANTRPLFPQAAYQAGFAASALCAGAALWRCARLWKRQAEEDLKLVPGVWRK